MTDARKALRRANKMMPVRDMLQSLESAGMLRAKLRPMNATEREAWRRYASRQDAVKERAPSWLYVVELIGVGVKIGWSTSPGKRLRDHASHSRDYGNGAGRAWVSEAHHLAPSNERTVKAARGGAEFLRGEDFDSTVAWMRDLPGAGPGQEFACVDEVKVEK